jgi:methylmalonyl-CoA mutase N-terminal domain/subunit
MGRQEWQNDYAAGPKRDADFETMSGLPLEPLYAPVDAEPPEQVGWPGQHPYTRGVHAAGYRGRLWTMRMFAGFGTAEDTNRRFHEILQAGGGDCRPPSTCRR